MSERTDLQKRACKLLGHRADSPCKASDQELLKQALDQLEAARRPAEQRHHRTGWS